MGEITNYVNLTITQDSVGLARASFDVPAILAYPSWTERSRTYASYAEGTVDFAVGTPENRALLAMFSQNPKPSRAKVLRGALKPTMLYTGTVLSVVNTRAYTINVVGPTYSGPATFTSDGTATNDEIVAGLVAALNAVSGNNYLAAVVDAGTADTFTVTGDNAGDWFSLEVAAANLGELKCVMTHADPGVATDLAAIAVEDSDWYALVTLFNSKLYAGAVAAWTETQFKTYFCGSCDGTIINTVIASADDVAEDFFDLSYERSTVWYHPSPAAMLTAAKVGRCLPLEPGSVSFANKTLAGVAAVALTSTQRANLVARNANSYEMVGTIGQTFIGSMAKTNQWIDITRNLDFIRDDMTKSIFEALAGANIIPYTDEGIAVIEGKVRGSLARAANKRIVDRATIVVTVPTAASAATVDKTARILRNVKFSFVLQGAIGKVFVTGVVSV